MPETPLEQLGVLGEQSIEITPTLRHLELFTLKGLLTILWHGDPEAPGIIVAVGGAMGGLLGPAGGLYHRLGEALAPEGVQTLRVSYRRPNDLGACVHDAAVATEIAARAGGRAAVALGHSFGGAVAVRLGAALPDVIAGVCTFATQSAGCEVAERLYGREVLLFHGDRDEILPVDCSLLVQQLSGAPTENLVILPGAGHLFAHEGPVLLDRLLEWVPATLAGAATA